MFTGATTLMQYFADEIQLNTLVFWTFGNLGNTTWADVGKMTGVLLCVCVYFFLHRWDFNALLSGEETATSLGINVKWLTMVNILLCCLTASVIVSYIGLINFIGLVAPHIVRLWATTTSISCPAPPWPGRCCSSWAICLPGW